MRLKQIIYIAVLITLASSFVYVPMPQKAQATVGVALISPTASPNPADASTTISGTAEGDQVFDTTVNCSGRFVSEYAPNTIGAPTNYAVINSGGSTVLSGAYTLTQTGVGHEATCPNQVNNPYKYSFSFPLTTSGLPNGTYTVQLTGIDGANGSTASGTTSLTISHPTGTIAVTSNKAGASWTFPSSASNPCGTCSGTSQTYSGVLGGSYTIAANAIAGFSFSVSSSAAAGSSCSSSTTCALGSGSQINFSITYTPTTGTVNVTNSRSWTLNGSPFSGNQSLTESAGSYTYAPSAPNYAESRADSCTSAGGSTCSSNTVGTLTGSGTLNFSSTYTATTCTVAILGLLNGNTQAATGQTFSVTGPSNASGTDIGFQTYTMPADSAGTLYNFGFTGSSPASTVTISGYKSSYSGINASSFTCFPNQTITFKINYTTQPVLQVH